MFNQVLRNNENSILAVLETFVYDPLINWRLVEDYEVDGHGRQIQVNIPLDNFLISFVIMSLQQFSYSNLK